MSTTTTTTGTEAITAESILRLFPDIDTSTEALSGHDAEQIRLMDEVCIVLDENDKPIGNASKKACKFGAPPSSPFLACLPLAYDRGGIQHYSSRKNRN